MKTPRRSDNRFVLAAPGGACYLLRMHTLLFMGEPECEDAVRCRIYDGTGEHDEQLAFIRTCAGPGAIDCPAYDDWVAALQERGWLPARPKLERNPDGAGKIGRWLLTDLGRSETEQMRREGGDL